MWLAFHLKDSQILSEFFTCFFHLKPSKILLIKFDLLFHLKKLTILLSKYLTCFSLGRVSGDLFLGIGLHPENEGRKYVVFLFTVTTEPMQFSFGPTCLSSPDVS